MESQRITEKRVEGSRMESNGSEMKSRRHRMEWNRIEVEPRAVRVERKEREHTRKRYRPTGGWAMRVSQQDIVSGISAKQVDQADRS